MILHPAVSEISSRRDQLAEAIRKGHLAPDVSRYARAGWTYVLKETGVPALAYPSVGNYDGAGDDDATLRYIITTDDEDRDGDVVRPMGAQLHNYSQNPLVFFGHQEKPIPIGVCRSEDGRILVSPEESRVTAGIRFDREDPDADFIYGKCKRKILNATSIAFVPVEAWRRGDVRKARQHGEGQAEPGWYFNLWDMTELSIVGVPSNPKAIGLEKDLMGACRDVWDQERKEMSPKLRKAWQPYIAQAKGCWGGWCPLPGDEKDLGNGVVLKVVEKGSHLYATRIGNPPSPRAGRKPSYRITGETGAYGLYWADGTPLAGTLNPLPRGEVIAAIEERYPGEAQKSAGDDEKDLGNGVVIKAVEKATPAEQIILDKLAQEPLPTNHVGGRAGPYNSQAMQRLHSQQKVALVTHQGRSVWVLAEDRAKYEDAKSVSPDNEKDLGGGVVLKAVKKSTDPDAWEDGPRTKDDQTAWVQKIGEELAASTDPAPMPGYGQVFRNGDRLWYVGGDGDEDGFADLVVEKLQPLTAGEVTYEAEGFPPKDEGWEQLYPQQKVWSKRRKTAVAKGARESADRIASEMGWTTVRVGATSMRFKLNGQSVEPTTDHRLSALGVRGAKAVQEGDEVVVTAMAFPSKSTCSCDDCSEGKACQCSKAATKAKDVPCPRCKGEGVITVSGTEQQCPRCNGAGVMFAAARKDASVMVEKGLFEDAQQASMMANITNKPEDHKKAAELYERLANEKAEAAKSEANLSNKINLNNAAVMFRDSANKHRAKVKSVKSATQADLDSPGVPGRNPNPAAKAGQEKAVKKRDVDEAATKYQRAQQQYGDNNMETQRAEIRYRELKDQWEQQTGQRYGRMKALSESSGAVGGYVTPVGRIQSNDAAGKPLDDATGEGWAACEGCHGDGNCEACGGTGEFGGTVCEECKGSGECGDCAGEGHVEKLMKTPSSKRKQLNTEDPPKPTTPQVLAALYSHAKAEAAYLDSLDEEHKGNLADYRRQQLDERMESLKSMFRTTERDDEDLEKLCKEFEQEHDEKDIDYGVEPGEAGMVEAGQVPPEIEEDDFDEEEEPTELEEKADTGETVESIKKYTPASLLQDYKGASAGEWMHLRALADDAGRLDLFALATKQAELAYRDQDKSQKRTTMKQNQVPADGGYIEDDKEAADELDSGAAPFNKAAPGTDEWAEEEATEPEHKAAEDELLEPEPIVEEKAGGSVCMCGVEVPEGAVECPGCGASAPAEELVGEELPPLEEDEVAEDPVAEEAVPPPDAAVTDPAAEEILERYQHPKSHKWATRKHLVKKSLLPFLKYRVAANGKKYMVRAKAAIGVNVPSVGQEITVAYGPYAGSRGKVVSVKDPESDVPTLVVQVGGEKTEIAANEYRKSIEPALDDDEVKALTTKLAGAIDDLKSLVKAKDLPRQYKAGLKHIADMIWYVGKALTDKGKEMKNGGKGSALSDKGKEMKNGGKGSELKDKGEQQGKSPTKGHKKSVSPAVEKKLHETLAKLNRFGVLNGSLQWQLPPI